MATQANAIQQSIDKGFCQLNYNAATNTRDIIDNQNANTRSILDFLVQNKIDSLNAENAALRGQISQSEQSAYLLSQLGAKAAIPAYIVQNPYASQYGTMWGGCSCNG